MSRRKVKWLKEIRRAGGNVDKILPSEAHGDGSWLASSENNHKRNKSSGICTHSIGNRKENLIRKWAH